MIRSLSDVARACEQGRYHCQRFIKTGAGQVGDGRWQDWAFQAGQPAYDARIGQALSFVPSVAQGNDAIYFPPIPDGMQRKLFKITMRPQASNASQASIDFALYDLVGYYPLIDGDSTEPQDLDNSLSFPRFADGQGLRMVMVNHVAPAGLLNGACSVAMTNVWQELKDGVAGVYYTLEFAATTNLGHVLIERATQEVIA